jgi:hypothetical protein
MFFRPEFSIRNYQFSTGVIPLWWSEVDGAIQKKRLGDALVFTVVPDVDPIGGTFVHHRKESLGYKGRDGGHGVIDLKIVHPDIKISRDLDVLPVQKARRGL